MCIIGSEYHGVDGDARRCVVPHVGPSTGCGTGAIRPGRLTPGGGVRFGDITAFGSGLITRGALLDVPRHRGTASTSSTERPVTGAELEAIAKDARRDRRTR